VFKNLLHGLVALIAGVLLYSSFKYDIWEFAILAIGLFYRELVDQLFRRRVLITAVFAAGFFVPLLWWISVLGFDALLLLAGLCIALFTLIAFVPLKSGNFWSKVEFASAWALVELIRSHFPWGGFSWGLLGYSQTSGPLVQYARFANTALVAFVVVLVATMIFNVENLGKIRTLLIVTGLVTLGSVLPSASPGGSLKVGVVQGGVVPKSVPEYARASQVFANHLLQTQLHTSLLRTADLVVWPENAVNLGSDSGLMFGQIQKVVDQIGVPFLIGVVRTNNEGRPENAVLLWLPQAGETASYVKNHLVPFGEYIPMRNLLAGHVGRLNQIPSDFAPGHGGGVIDVLGTQVGVAICFEVSDQTHLTRLVNSGANMFIAASNNATYLGTQQPAQQFQISRFIAIAHQRSMVVSTTTGISGVISADGKVENKIDNPGASVFVSDVKVASGSVLADRYPCSQYAFALLLFGLSLTRRMLANNQLTRANRSAA